jgi:hypothetical protein
MKINPREFPKELLILKATSIQAKEILNHE